MGERKVINKYFPPDFDPSKIPRPDKRQQEKVKEKFGSYDASDVRSMPELRPVHVQGQEVQLAQGERRGSEGPEGQYLGIQIFRFYFKCITCSAEFTIKTDPQNMDYVCEGGAKANFELYKEENKEKEEIKAAREEDEKYDAMKKLENKTQEQKNAMDILDALDEIRTNNARAATLGVDGVLNARDEMFAKQEAKVQSREEAEDEAALKAAFAGSRVKRMAAEDEDDEEEDLRRGSSTAGVASTHATTTRRQQQQQQEELSRINTRSRDDDRSSRRSTQQEAKASYGPLDTSKAGGAAATAGGASSSSRAGDEARWRIAWACRVR